MGLKVAIVGYGRMGREIEDMACVKGVDVVSIIDRGLIRDGIFYERMDGESIKPADVCIDFTSADGFIDNLRVAAEYGRNVVVGTTGWYDRMDEAKKIVEDSGIGFVYAPNFSVGVNLYLKVVEYAAKLFDRFPAYDAYVYELHHNRKADSPSGTALEAARRIVDNMERKSVVTTNLSGKIEPYEINVASVRAGSISGTHVVGFDSPDCNMEFRNEARDRSGFADGALLAAEWINGRSGFFSFDDVMAEIIRGG